MAIRVKDSISYFFFSRLEDMGCRHGIFMRHGGVSPTPWRSLNHATSVGDSQENVIENRTRAVKALGLDPKSVFDVWQVHSEKVVVTNSPRPLNQPHQQADAIVTNNQNVSLLMLFADCVPIFIIDPVQRIISLAHAGWKGTVKNITGKTIEKMVEVFKSNAKEMEAFIGPSIYQHHYPVGQEVVEAVKTVMDPSRVVEKRESDYYLDLVAANKINLMNSGVSKVHSSGICTHCNTTDWFSHRAEMGKTGRFAAVISLKNAEA